MQKKTSQLITSISRTHQNSSSWWLNNPFEKYARQNGFIFPNFSGCIYKIFELPPPRASPSSTLPPVQRRLNWATPGKTQRPRWSFTKAPESRGSAAALVEKVESIHESILLFCERFFKVEVFYWKMFQPIIYFFPHDVFLICSNYYNINFPSMMCICSNPWIFTVNMHGSDFFCVGD